MTNAANRPSRCRACLSPFRNAIDTALLSGATLQSVATKYRIGMASIKGHKYTCLRKAVKSETEGLPAGMLTNRLVLDHQRLEDLYTKIEYQLNRAIESNDTKTILQCVKTGRELLAEGREQIRLAGEFTGELGSGSTAAQPPISIAKAVIVMPRSSDLAGRRPLELDEPDDSALPDPSEPVIDLE